MKKKQKRRCDGDCWCGSVWEDMARAPSSVTNFKVSLFVRTSRLAHNSSQHKYMRNVLREEMCATVSLIVDIEAGIWWKGSGRC